MDLIATTWSEQDNNNTASPPSGITGNMSPSSLAPTIRAMMGATKRFYNQINPLVTSTGTGAAYVLTYVQNPTAYSKGIRYSWFAHADNTGAATVNIGSIGAKQLLSVHGLPLTAGQIKADDFVEMIYTGTSFQLIAEQKHSPLFMQSATIQASGNNSPTLSLSANSTIRAQASSGLSGGFNVTLRNANNAIVKSLIVPETGNMSFGGDIIWTSGNMGANSAMNADLLDGQHGSFYSDLTNSTGTLPNARLSGNYSFGGLTLSGDLSANTVIASASDQPTYAFVRNGIKTGQITADGASTYLRRFNSTTGAAEGYIRITGNGVNDVQYNGNTMWHAGNDGSGSGLDAGLLEGQNAAYFRNLANSTGTLPNARISGAYDGITNLSMTGTLGITSAAPTINFIDTTAGSWNTRLIVDANNWYLQKQADGSTAWTTFAQFEMDTTNAYLNGSQILTSANHGHISLGTTQATARTALGLGEYAYLNRSTFYTAGAIGTYAFARRSGSTDPDFGDTIAGSSLQPTNGNASVSGTLSGTWRCFGYVQAGSSTSGAVTLWVRIS